MPEEFGCSVLKYWREINPDWRVELPSGHLEPSGTGSWTKLQFPRQNGLLSILACLYWWFIRLEIAGGTANWAQAVKDVHWVLSSMHQEFSEEEEQVDEGPDGEPAAKRAKTN